MVKIKISKIKNRDNKPIPVKNAIEYPQSNDSDLPRNFFTCLAIGQTGTGKSFSVCKLLKYCEQSGYSLKDGTKVEQRIILIAPTASANPIYKSLKYLKDTDIHTEYTDQLLKDILEDIQTKREEAEKYQKCILALKKFAKVKSEYELTNQELILLNSIDFDIKNLGEPEYKVPPVVHLVLDDLTGSSAFKSVGQSAINNLSVKVRHHFCNLYVLSQTTKNIPKIVRGQARLIMLYRTNSETLLKEMWEFVSMKYTYNDFKLIYDYVTEKVKYQFLCIDNTGKDLILKQNLESVIDIETVKNANTIEEAKKQLKA